jgi:hypothetical protein
VLLLLPQVGVGYKVKGKTLSSSMPASIEDLEAAEVRFFTLGSLLCTHALNAQSCCVCSVVVASTEDLEAAELNSCGCSLLQCFCNRLCLSSSMPASIEDLEAAEVRGCCLVCLHALLDF